MSRFYDATPLGRTCLLSLQVQARNETRRPRQLVTASLAQIREHHPPTSIWHHPRCRSACSKNLNGRLDPRIPYSMHCNIPCFPIYHSPFTIHHSRLFRTTNILQRKGIGPTSPWSFALSHLSWPSQVKSSAGNVKAHIRSPPHPHPLYIDPPPSS